MSYIITDGKLYINANNRVTKDPKLAFNWKKERSAINTLRTLIASQSAWIDVKDYGYDYNKFKVVSSSKKIQIQSIKEEKIIMANSKIEPVECVELGFNIQDEVK